jgi:putative FmdB family regulatory protein
LYEYECEACGQRFELIRKFSDPAVEVCAKCGRGPVTRLMSSPAIQFKGSGWYITDYAKKGETGESGKTSAEKAQDAKSDAAAAGKTATTEGKTETATKTDSPAKSDSSASPPRSSSSSTSGTSKD